MERRAKKLGQCFLSDYRVIDREIDYAAPEGKTILEIGAGDGRLTMRLAEKAKHVIAVEKDDRMLEFLLPLVTQYRNLEILHGDFLELDFSDKRFDVIFSNVPYVISSPLLFKLATMRFDRAVLCLQKEFVDRMLAKPGDKKRSRLSVMSQLHFDVWGLESVPRTAFKPRPKVDSTIIELHRRDFRATEFQSEFINKLFQHKVRTVRRALRDAYGRQVSELKTNLDERRVFSLTNEEVLKLAKELEPLLTLT
ncbi:MAG: 16S rRNA (adenine(1518)-N(6)/adenine(1519)-N(6))-dimethyltransferase RsmA [Candidatus Burarchaeum sp.]|nr:16S rRNA (adenine(1518)-N(6)/adenine(1519)-N(6))-dimethyltransferase RsmA [Candidatus Burarchaeum sp.]MDO8339205.1 16S rRNA (adenine(1518)-N(6)/adenine(1519)-N(6))-dimethyltransferase RsmA [Candidatus Burarchaeum sp.]